MEKIDKVFPFGFWNYHSLGSGVQKPEEVKRWADCGMTLTMSPSFSYKDNTVQEMIDMLDACQEHGMKLFVNVQELQYLKAQNEEQYRADFKRAYEDFGHHPATFGFFVGDEPSTTYYTDICVRAYNIQKEIAPELYPYVNHLAEWDGMEIGNRTFTQWLHEYIEATNAWMISFDHYGQMIKVDAGIESYYHNLKIYSDAAIKYNTDMWITLLASGHFNFLTPNDDDALWQLNTSVACGAKGIFWYMFYGGIRQGGSNYRGAPIDEFNEKSDTYYAIKRAQDRFHLMHGKIFPKLKLKKIYMLAKSYGGFPLFAPGDHDIIKNVVSVDNMPVIVSFFEDANGKEYVVICSNSFDQQGLVQVSLDRTKFNRFNRVCLNGERIAPFLNQSDEQRKNAKAGEVLTTDVWLGPGQLELFTID